nr:general transcription factor II-I repeat domain-containing protein 2A-like [Onthophagus taurus]
MLSLKRELIGQQAMFIKPIQDSETATEVSYEISRMIAKRSRPFNDGDFVKECIEIAAKKMCPEAAKKFEKIQLNRMTIQRRIMSLSALDESTDISSTAQLLIFIRGVTQDFEVLEELLGMCSLKGQTKGVDILNVLLDECSKTDLDLSKLSGVATDGAPSMIGVNSGLVTLLKKHLQEKNINAEDLMQFHCIIHQEALCSKKIEFQNVMKVVVSTVNFIKSRGLNHRQFKQFLDDIESEYGDLLYYTELCESSKPRATNSGRGLMSSRTAMSIIVGVIALVGNWVKMLGGEDEGVVDLGVIEDDIEVSEDKDMCISPKF